MHIYARMSSRSSEFNFFSYFAYAARAGGEGRKADRPIEREMKWKKRLSRGQSKRIFFAIERNENVSKSIKSLSDVKEWNTKTKFNVTMTHFSHHYFFILDKTLAREKQCQMAKKKWKEAKKHVKNCFLLRCKSLRPVFLPLRFRSIILLAAASRKRKISLYDREIFNKREKRSLNASTTVWMGIAEAQFGNFPRSFSTDKKARWFTDKRWTYFSAKSTREITSLSYRRMRRKAGGRRGERTIKLF